MYANTDQQYTRPLMEIIEAAVVVEGSIIEEGVVGELVLLEMQRGLRATGATS